MTPSVTISPTPYYSGGVSAAQNGILSLPPGQLAGVVVGSALIVGTAIAFIAYLALNNAAQKGRSPVSSAVVQPNPLAPQTQALANPLQQQAQAQQQQQAQAQQQQQPQIPQAEKWTQHSDGTDTWYVSPEGVSSWTLPDGARV
jgi:hypothetical protein